MFPVNPEPFGPFWLLIQEVVMSKLFEKANIDAMALKNRFVRSATWEGMAKEDGACTQKLINLMEQLARGQVGLIVTG